MKLHRNFKFGPQTGEMDLQPTSVFITTLAAFAYKIRAPQPHASPLDLLLDVVETMPSMFHRTHLSSGREEWVLPNPAAPKSNLADSMNTPARQYAFNRWVDVLTSDIEAILAAIETRAGMHEVAERVEQGFGARSARAVRDALFPQQQSTRLSGKTNLVTSSAGAIAIPSRRHTFFGSH